MSSINSNLLVQKDYSTSAKDFLQRRPALFVDNEWIRSSSGADIPVVDPSSGDVVASIAESTSREVDLAVSAARRAFDDGRWSTTLDGRPPPPVP